MKSEENKALVVNEELHREMFRLIQEQAVIQCKILNLIEASKPENKSKKFWADLGKQIDRALLEQKHVINFQCEYHSYHLEKKMYSDQGFVYKMEKHYFLMEWKHKYSREPFQMSYYGAVVRPLEELMSLRRRALDFATNAKSLIFCAL